MATATIVRAWKSHRRAFVAFRLAGDGVGPTGQPCDAEYIGSTPLFDHHGRTKAKDVLLAECVASAKAKRDGDKDTGNNIDFEGDVIL